MEMKFDVDILAFTQIKLTEVYFLVCSRMF